MSVEDDIYEAAKAAINSGMDVNMFLKAAWRQWDVVLYENGKYADISFDRALRMQ